MWRTCFCGPVVGMPFLADFTIQVVGVPPDVTEEEVADHFRNLLDRKVVEVRNTGGVNSMPQRLS